MWPYAWSPIGGVACRLPNHGIAAIYSLASNGLMMWTYPGLTRITFDPEVMGGKPCIRGLRVTVGTIVGLVAAGRTVPDILAAYPTSRKKTSARHCLTPPGASKKRKFRSASDRVLASIGE